MQSYFVFTESPDELTLLAVSRNYKTALSYCTKIYHIEPDIQPLRILFSNGFGRMLHFYPQTESNQVKIDEKIKNCKYEPYERSTLEDDGCLLLLNNQPGLNSILGNMPVADKKGDAYMFSDEYLAVYPNSVIEFFTYKLDTIYYLPLKWALDRSGWPEELVPDTLGLPYR